MGKPAADGQVSKWFIDLYNELKDRSQNIGWEIINRMVAANKKMAFNDAFGERLDKFHKI